MRAAADSQTGSEVRLKVLIADDERHILDNLRTVLPWEEMGFDVVGLAQSGEQALELAERFGPDLVLSDIRMPNMDGLAFVERLKELRPDVEVLMITGYQDFEYARAMIRLGVRDYILKPIDYEKLEETIRILADSLRERRRRERLRESEWRELSTLAYHKLLHDLLVGHSGLRLKYYSPLDEMFSSGIDLERTRFVFLLADLEDFASTRLFWGESERKLWNFAVRNVLQDAVRDFGPRAAVVQMRHGEWCVLVETAGRPSPTFKSEVEGWVERLRDAVFRHAKCRLVFAAFGRPVPAERLAEAYRVLRRKIQLAVWKSEPLVWTDGTEWKPGGRPAEPLSEHRAAVASTDGGRERLHGELWEMADAVSRSFRQHDPDGVEQALRRLDERLETLGEDSWDRMEHVLRFVIVQLMRDMRELGVLRETEEEEMWKQLASCEDLRDARELLRELVALGGREMRGKKNAEALMLAAKDYIDRHLGQPFGLEDVADALGISYSYFSLLFKQHFGATFVEYVTRERIERAKWLLERTDRSITDIGKAVGYAERRYFTKVFQKLTGVIPSEYRAMRRQAAAAADRRETDRTDRHETDRQAERKGEGV